MTRTNKKVFIFRQGNCTMNVLHSWLLKSFALSICRGILWKTQPWNIFARIRKAKCTASCKHDGSLEDNYCVSFFKLKLFISTSRHIFCAPKPSKVYGEDNFVSSVSRNKSGKCAILWFKKKRLLFLMRGKYKWILRKNMLSSFLVDITFLHTFLLYVSLQSLNLRIKLKLK